MGRGKFLWRRKLIALRKLFALVILTPLEVAFAQDDAGTETAATDSGSSTPPPAPSPTTPPTPAPSGVDATPPASDESANPSSDSEAAASSPSAPSTDQSNTTPRGSSPTTPPVTPPPAPPPSGFGSNGAPCELSPTRLAWGRSLTNLIRALGTRRQGVRRDIIQRCRRRAFTARLCRR
jgi:hypothetical protein